MYMLDTKIFNKLVDGLLELASLPSDGEFIATHVQMDELNATRNTDRREVLLQKFSEIAPRVVKTESAVWDVSNWGQSSWGTGPFYDSLRGALDQRNKAKPNNAQDALIAEVSIAKGYTLITADRDLATVVLGNGGQCQFVENQPL